jgi:ubiquinone/menaquinone biosynthesis C-methylase UbiE
MTEPNQYLLGYRGAEQDRLQRQALELAGDSTWLFEQVGLAPGQSVAEIGCGPQGCLDLLAAAVGPTGTVVGIERSDEAVARAREHVSSRGLTTVTVRNGDGRDTKLPGGAFDLVTSRLVLINVPQPHELVAEAVRLAKPGGTVAYHEAVWPLHTCDPPLDAWDELYEIFQAYADLNGIDLFIGRRMARLLREQGLVDIQSNAITHIYPVTHGRRLLASDFVENLSEPFLEQGLVGSEKLQQLKADLKRHLEDPNTFVISCLFVQAWGRKP